MSDPNAIKTFLSGAGWGDADRRPLAGDASNRSYDRLRRGNDRAVLMIAPPEKGEDVRPFVQVTDILRDWGLSAPEILASDPAQGLLLIEDLGDDLMARLAGDPTIEAQMYAAAVDVLADTAVRPVPADIPPYDRATYVRESRLIVDWYRRAATGETMAAPEFDTLIADACEGLGQGVLVQRDYHSENLIWLPDRTGVARIGLLDYQDALAGDAAYDLVSLLEDARRDTSPALRDAMTDRFLSLTGIPRDGFMRAYNTLGAQRNLKIVGIFARLCMRDGKDIYLRHIPRVWDHVQRDLAHPALRDLRDWVDANIPAPTPEIIDKIRGRRGAG